MQHFGALLYLYFMTRTFVFYLLLPGLCGLAPAVWAQNLIRNPSFEQIQPRGVVVPCEFMQYTNRFMETIQNWETFRDMTPDILGAAENCPWLPRVPGGELCAGLIYYLPAADAGQPGGYREAIQGRLCQPLRPGQRYRFSVWVREDPALMRLHLKKVYDNKTPVVPVQASHLGVCFTVTPLDVRAPLDYQVKSLRLQPQVLFDQIIQTKGEWVQLSASFVADQPYMYLTIGNFSLENEVLTSLSPAENRRLDSLNARIPSSLDKYKRVAYVCMDDLLLTPENPPPPPSDFETRLLKERRVSFNAALLFDSGKADLRPEALPALDSLVSFLLKYPQRRVGISGHTDDVGAEEYNMDLSARRAQAVHAYLLEKKVPPAAVEWKAFGESRPVADNTSEAGRQQNRRVDCVLLR
jgi:outer membrane protein OmpA-like peptidoglycan-associated protein